MTLLDRRRRGERLILAYHNILPEGESAAGDRSLHLPQQAFGQQLDLLSEVADVCSLEEVLFSADADSLPKIAITFDDAYSGAMTAGISELHQRGMPATIFVPPGCLGARSFWWDVLAETRGLEDDIRRFALDSCAGRDRTVREWARSAGLPVNFMSRSAVSASLSEMEKALEHSGISFGSHTWSHPNLTRVSDGDLETELAGSLDWLRAHFGSRVGPWLTYPYGLTDDRVELATRALGYAASFRVDGGWLPPTSTLPFGLPRLNIPAGLSTDGFRLRLAGLFCR